MNSYSFVNVRKFALTSTAWKNILNSRFLLKKGLKWIIGSNANINF